MLCCRHLAASFPVALISFPSEKQEELIASVCKFTLTKCISCVLFILVYFLDLHLERCIL